MPREISCVNKRDRPNIHEHIIAVGGVHQGERWKKLQFEVITDIENHWESYYVVKNAIRVNVVIATSVYGHKYIKTERDDVRPDNLLRLAECV